MSEQVLVSVNMVTVCSACSVKIQRYDDNIKCAGCISSFHIKCVNISVEDFVAKSTDGSVLNWKCRECVDLTSRHSDVAPVSVERSSTTGSVDMGEPITVSKDLMNYLISENNELKQLIRQQSVEFSVFKNELTEQVAALRLQISKQEQSIALLTVGLRDSRKEAKIGEGPGASVRISKTSQQRTQQVYSAAAGGCNGAAKENAGGNELPSRRKPISGQDKTQNVIFVANHLKSVNESEALGGASVTVQSASQTNPAPAGGGDSDGFTVFTGRRNGKKSKKDDRQQPSQENARKFVIGSGNTDKLKTVPKKAYLFVSRLDPSTTTDDLQALLRDRFPEVLCEQMASKYPQYYSSFKVTIYLHRLGDAMDPGNWPDGCYISRFFHRKSGTSTST